MLVRAADSSAGTRRSLVTTCCILTGAADDSIVIRSCTPSEIAVA